jgi:hypothetical protein
LVKVPPTSREAPEERVKLFALLIVVFPVEVAFSVIDQPPVVESKVRWWKVEEPGATSSPPSVEVKVTVPRLLSNDPPTPSHDPATSYLPEGSTTAPFVIVMSFVVDAFVSANVHPPPTPLKVTS